MKLYYSPGSCAMSVDLALCEAGLAFERIRVLIDSIDSMIAVTTPP
jgi:glutathione S-transferase